MLLKRILLVSTFLFVLCVEASAQQWDKYIPEKQQKNIIKKAVRGTGLGAIMKVGASAGVYWVTEQVAQALVSQVIDRQRLTSEEAEKEFQKLRQREAYTFIIYTVSMGSQPLLMGRPKTAGETIDPLSGSAFFLQRADNRKVFSKGNIEITNFDIAVTTRQTLNKYIVTLPKIGRSGDSLVHSLEDKLEVQFYLSGKEAILDYKVKDLVTRLEDL